MRISVEQILKILARGISHDDIIKEFPMLEVDDIKACLVYAASKISLEETVKKKWQLIIRYISND